jgi:hypothetical protein
MSTATITCHECDCIVDVTFGTDVAELHRTCPYCATALPPLSVAAANIVLARSETRAVARAFTIAIHAFAKALDKDLPDAPAYAAGVMDRVRGTFVDGPLQDAFR